MPNGGVELLLGQAGDTSIPVAWAKDVSGRRQFHTTLGAAEDFRQASFCRTLANAVAWIGRKQDDACDE